MQYRRHFRLSKREVRLTVHRDRQNALVIGQDRRRPVTLVNIEIEYRHSLVVQALLRDTSTDREVIKHTISGAKVIVGVVSTASGFAAYPRVS